MGPALFTFGMGAGMGARWPGAGRGAPLGYGARADRVSFQGSTTGRCSR